MLAESFIASISAPSQKPNTSVTKDVGIFQHELQPLADQRHLYKKSATPPNCLAVSASHIFAAQEEKAVMHVYSREKGNQEALVPLQERIHAVALAANDSVLVLGTESGRVLLWEVSTGRLVAAPTSHLQKISVIAVEQGSNFLLTGSADSSVNVWSLSHLLSFSSNTESKSPIYTLTSHRGAITSLAIGHSSSDQNIAVSTASDNTAIVWDYHIGRPLRTYLLVDAPRSICLDPADRAFYVGFDDGSVQLIDFYDTTQRHQALDTLRSTSETAASSIVEPPRSSRWSLSAENLSLGAALSLALSWDGTTLLSGHASGKISTWDISQGRWSSTLSTLPGPVTNLHMLPPAGFPNASQPKTRLHTIVKPRPETTNLDSSAPVPSSYTITTQFTSHLCTPNTSLTSPPPASSSFAAALTHPSFPTPLLDAGLAELASWTSAPAKPSAAAIDSDFMSLKNESPAIPLLTEYERIQDLEERLAALQRVQKVTFGQLAELRRERDEWRGGAGRASRNGVSSATGKRSPQEASAEKNSAGKNAEANEDEESEEDEDEDEMDVDKSNEEAEEIDIDEKLKYFKSSDEEWSSEGQSVKSKRKHARKGKRKGKK